MAWAGGRGASRVNRLDRLDNPGLRVAHDFLAFAASPDPAHLGQQSFSISDAVELEVDHDVVRILHRSEHLITTNARPFASAGSLSKARFQPVKSGTACSIRRIGILASSMTTAKREK